MSERYTSTAKALHWLMAILFFGLLALGFYMQDLPLSPEKLKLYSWHKWAGVTAFLLVLVRLGWRATHLPPALPASMPKIMQFAAHAVHLMLYLLMIAIPLSGSLMSSAKGFQTVYFGVLPIPDLLDKNKEVGDLLQTVHMSLNLLFVATLLGHIGAALKHHFIDKDDMFDRDGVIYANSSFMRLKPEEKPYQMRVRFRTIGDMSCTGAVDSPASTLEEIIEEVASSRVTERGSRMDDKRSEAAMEDRKKEGYF